MGPETVRRLLPFVILAGAVLAIGFIGPHVTDHSAEECWTFAALLGSLGLALAVQIK